MTVTPDQVALTLGDSCPTPIPYEQWDMWISKLDAAHHQLGDPQRIHLRWARLRNGQLRHPRGRRAQGQAARLGNPG